jgi:hypothetical protein
MKKLTALGFSLLLPWTLEATTQININIAAKSCPTCSVKHPISPLIYGWQYYATDHYTPAQITALKELKLSLVRWGSGNNSTRYNWKVKGATHPDWYSNNYPHDYEAELAQIKSLDGPQVMFTMPSMKLPGKDAIFVASDNSTANGSPEKGLNTGKYWTTDFSSKDEQDWLRSLNIKNAATQYVKFWEMDNEAMCWGSTHKDIHNTAHGFKTNGTTYDEYWEDFSFLVPKMKAVDPNIIVGGDVPPNYYFYYFDGNFQKKDNVDWETWFLRRNRDYEKEKGQRILDVLSLHFYPETYGKKDASAELRLDETRNWWDPSYTQSPECVKHWPDTCPTTILPKMQGLIAKNYPGTKLGFSEYAWGDDASPVGALCLGLTLGWFGKYDVYYSTYWADTNALVSLEGEPQPMYHTLYMYTHYFGSLACKAESSDALKIASFAATDSAGNLTLMLINPTKQAQSAEIRLEGYTPATQARAVTYTFSSAGPKTLVKGSLKVPGSQFKTSLPAYSQVCLIIPKKP